MRSLSLYTFEWDEADYNQLMSAKRGELIMVGVRNPSPAAIRKATTRVELARHCKRSTRGATATVSLIKMLLLELTFADASSERLFKDDMMTIWREQKRHVVYLQDPPEA